MRLLAVIGAAVVAAVVWFVIEVWRIARETDVTPAYEPTDEELDHLSYGGTWGMPTYLVGEHGPELLMMPARSYISLLD